MFGRTERFGQGSANMAEPVRPYWPNLFGRICRICLAVFAEHVRPYLPKVFGRSTTRQPTVKFTYLLIINKYQYVLFLPNCLVLIWLSTLKKICPSTENQEVLLTERYSSALCSSNRPALISNNSLQTFQCFIPWSSLPSEYFSWSIIIFTMEYSQNPTTIGLI